MRSKVRYPDDYIRNRRSIIAVAELTCIYEDEPGWFSVVIGGEEYAVRGLYDAFDLASSHILDGGTADSLSFIQEGPDLWRPDIFKLRRDLGQANGRRRK